MRWLVALLVCMPLRPAHFEGSINGVWVMQQRLSRFAGPTIPDRVVMKEYAIHPSGAMRAPEDNTTAKTNCFVLLSKSTGIIEEWTMAPDGSLLIQRPLPTVLGTERDLLVFQRAEAHGIGVVK